MNDKLIIGKMLMDYGLVAWYHQKKKKTFLETSSFLQNGHMVREREAFEPRKLFRGSLNL